MNLRDLAARNLEELSANPYPGRIVYIGYPSGADGELLMATGATSRSTKNRNRRYGVDGGRVFTEAADPSKMTEEDAKLIIYNAMNEIERLGSFVASNGDHTDAALERISSGMANFGGEPFDYFCGAMMRQTYEPDASSTPRIAAICSVYNDTPTRIGFAVVRRSLHSAAPERSFFVLDEVPPGYGYYLRTYEGTPGDPIPSFRGEPVLLPCEGTPEEALNSLWDALKGENGIAAAGKVIDPVIGSSRVLPPINRY